MKRKLICLILPILFCSYCSKAVITSSEIDVSEGTMKFLLLSFFQDEIIETHKPAASSERSNEELQAMHRRSDERILSRIKDLIASGLLADKYGFRKDEFYNHYTALQRRGRRGRAAGVYFSIKLGENISVAEKLKLLKIELSPLKINEIIEKQVVREGSKVTTRDPMGKIILGSHGSRQISLADILEYGHVDENSRLLAFSFDARPAAITEAVNHYINVFAHDKLRDELSASEKQLRAFDHNRAAELYVSALFGKAGKGVYPAPMLDLKFSSTELYDHYFEILPTLTTMQSIEVEGAAFRSEAAAEKFKSLINPQKSIRPLCKNHQEVLNCNLRWQITGYKNAMDLAEREERSDLDNWLLRSALRSEMIPAVREINNAWLAARIVKINYSDEEPTFEKYLWAVKSDLTVKSLNLLLESEMSKIMNNLNFTTDVLAFSETVRSSLDYFNMKKNK